MNAGEVYEWYPVRDKNGVMTVVEFKKSEVDEHPEIRTNIHSRQCYFDKTYNKKKKDNDKVPEAE
jgi:hypothetical protein